MERREFKLNPFVNLTPIEYYGLLKSVNLNYQEELRGFLKCFLGNNLGEVSFILTGSDGKMERHCQSKTEIIIIGNDPLLVSGIRDRVGRLFRESVFSIDRGDPKDKLPEGRTLLNKTETLSYAYNDPNLVYPDRVLHSQLLIGSEEIHRQGILEILDEIITKRRIYQHMEKQLEGYKKAFREGVYRGKTVFSWEEGIQYYQENEDPKLLKLGFKIGPIRAVQRKLDLITFKALRNDEQLREEIVGGYIEGSLSNTMERIEFLTKIGLIPEDLSDKLIVTYYWFLQEYHRAQEIYKKRRCPVKLPFDINLGADYKETIEEFFKIK